jgi:glycosyltransferase involved in cell wall biosynthesis
MISAVICTANPRLGYLQRVVESMLSQDLDSQQWELLIVDNASASPVAALPVVSQHGLRVVREERVGLTAAKERAAREVTGEVVVFVDDDNVLAPDYLSTVAELFEDPRLGVVGPHIEPEYEIEPPNWFLDPRMEANVVIRRLPNERLYVSTIPETGSHFPSGAGSCVRRSILTAYFDSLTEETRIEGRLGMKLSGGEDWDIGLYAICQGYLVGTCGKLRLTHLIPSTRLEPAYIGRLVVGSLDGAARVNDKWKQCFGHDVVPYFRSSATLEVLKGVVRLSLAASPRYRVLARFHLRLAWLLFRRRLRHAAVRNDGATVR